MEVERKRTRRLTGPRHRTSSYRYVRNRLILLIDTLDIQPAAAQRAAALERR